jgi:hypothetical protein
MGGDIPQFPGGKQVLVAALRFRSFSVLALLCIVCSKIFDI